MDGEDEWLGKTQRCGVRRREEHVEVVAPCRAREVDLLPPRAAGAGHQPGWEAAAVERQRDLAWRVQDEFVTTRIDPPTGQQAAEIAADAGRAAAELARVDAYAHELSPTKGKG